VNYILGQQMVGGKQQTVVVDYTSKTDQEELEYQELSYEQATSDHSHPSHKSTFKYRVPRSLFKLFPVPSHYNTFSLIEF